LRILLIIFVLIFQGCGSSDTTTYTTGLGDGSSVTRTDVNSVISNDALNKISDEIGNILKTNIIAFNNDTEISYKDETNYCDISGMRESSMETQMNKVNNTISYNQCKEQESTQNGQISLEYLEVDHEGKCPKCLNVKIDKPYTFNNIQLSQDVVVESDVVYDKNNNIQELTFKVNGNVTYKNENYHLQNITKIINY